MRRSVAALAVLFAAACATRGGPAPSTTRGAISIAIDPNPIVARHVRGAVYEFPFEVVIRETGGSAVDIQRVTADVFALGALKVAAESYDRARMESLGYPTTIPPNGEMRYRFSQRHEVAAESLLNTVHVDLRVEGTDSAGVGVTTTTRVTVKR